jgi:hypothetical protein
MLRTQRWGAMPYRLVLVVRNSPPLEHLIRQVQFRGGLLHGAKMVGTRAYLDLEIGDLELDALSDDFLLADLETEYVPLLAQSVA